MCSLYSLAWSESEMLTEEKQGSEEGVECVNKKGKKEYIYLQLLVYKQEQWNIRQETNHSGYLKDKGEGWWPLAG